MSFQFDDLREPHDLTPTAQTNTLANGSSVSNRTQTQSDNHRHSGKSHAPQEDSILIGLDYNDSQNGPGIVSLDALEQVVEKPSDNSQSSALNYYHQEYCRLFLANVALTTQVKELLEEKNHLKYRLSKYEDEQCFSSFERNEKASKRFRRNAHEIERFYKCTVKSCGKSYGSEGSLNQHYKLKHPDVYVQLPNVQTMVGGLKEEGESQQTSKQVKKNEAQVGNKQTRGGRCNDSNNKAKSTAQRAPFEEKHENSSFYGHNFSPLGEKSSSGASHNKINSILKEFGEMHSFKSIKIEELKFEQDPHESRENKENKCSNAFHNLSIDQSNKKATLVNFSQSNSIEVGTANHRNAQSVGKVKSAKAGPLMAMGSLKRSSRVIKKRQLC